MTRTQAAAWATFAVLAGGFLFLYLVFYVSPRQAAGQISPLALLGFFAGLIFFVGGASALVALALHDRWPALAGASARTKKDSQPNPAVALRQGGLLAGMVAILAGLSMLSLLDPAFVVVTILLGGLVEAYFQRG